MLLDSTPQVKQVSLMSGNLRTGLNMTSLTDLTGKVALVTGGGTGIGLMIAKGLASSGAKVYISGRRLEVVQKAAAEHHFEGMGSLAPLQMDVNDKGSITDVVKQIDAADGKLNILVNNAGTDGPRFFGKWTADSDSVPDSETLATYGQELFNQTFEQWDAVARTNVSSVFFVTTALLGLLVKSTTESTMASVINITSVFAHSRLSYGMFAYDCFKAATSHLTQLLATDLSLKRAPVRVNAISPGTFPSAMTSTEETLQNLLQTNFMGSLSPNPMRRPGREEEMAALAVYLASPASEYVHGQEITIDGGFTRVNP